MHDLLKTVTACALAAAALTAATPSVHAQDDPVIKIHAGKYYDWYTDQKTWDAIGPSISPDFAIFDNAVDQVVKDWGTTPPTTHLYCFIDASGQNGAYATGDISQVDGARNASPSPGIGIDSNLFTAKGYGVSGGTAIVFGVHEMVNDLTGQVSAGWPRDWWADDRSPFPGMTEVHLLNEMGYTDIATADDKDLSRDPLYVMDKNIQAHYGWGIFSRTFSHMATDHVSWTQVDDGHNPSAIMTNRVCAYLTMGSGDTAEGIDPLFTSGPIPGYSLDTLKADLKSLGYGGGALADGAYAITSVKSGLVLDGGGSAQLKKTGDGQNQGWAFTPLGNDTYTIKNAATGLVLGESGSRVTLTAASKSAAQKWVLSSTDNGYVLANKKSGLVLASSDGKLQVTKPGDTTAGKWIIH